VQKPLSFEKGALMREVSQGTKVSVSIIVPARNEEKSIARCLDSLLCQDYESICEILVFDGVSEDRTRHIVQQIATKKPLIRLMDNPKIQQAGAMNAGITMAKGEIVIRADAHAQYEQDYVSQCVHHLETTDASNVGGPMRPVIGPSLIEKAIGFCYLSRFGMGVARFHNSRAEGYADTVWLGAFWKKVLDKLGPFNEEVPRIDDILYNYRLRAAGYKIFLTPRIKSFYFPTRTLRAFLKKAFNNGFAIGRAFLLLPRAFASRHFAPFGFVVTLLIVGVLSVPMHWLRLPFAMLLALHLSLGVAFSLPCLRSGGLRLFGIMPLVFLALHFQYGVGTLCGLAGEILFGGKGVKSQEASAGGDVESRL
jgi:succinoglycan biosynthesis protein ExoA